MSVQSCSCNFPCTVNELMIWEAYVYDSERPTFTIPAKPFSRYSTLKIEIWTILREKTTEKPKMLFSEKFCKNWRTINCVTPEILSAQFNNNQSRIFPSIELISTWNFMDKWFDTSKIRLWYFCCYHGNHLRTTALYLKTKKALLCWNAVILRKNIYRN